MLDQDDRFNIVELSDPYESQNWFQRLSKLTPELLIGTLATGGLVFSAIALPRFVQDPNIQQVIYLSIGVIAVITVISYGLYRRNWFDDGSHITPPKPAQSVSFSNSTARSTTLGQLIKTDKLSPEPYLKRLIQTLPGTVIRVSRDRSRIDIEKDYGLPVDSIISELQLIGKGATEKQSPLWELHRAIEDTFESGRSHRTRFNLMRDGRRLLLDARCIPGNQKSLWLLLKDIEQQAEIIPITGLNERKF